MEEARDRTSELPEHILHHIQSFLPIKSASQTRFLSKTWSSAWFSIPILDFDQSQFPPHPVGFAHFLQEILTRYLKNEQTVPVLILSVSLPIIPSFWIDAALKICVKEFHLSIENFHNRLSPTIQRVCNAKQLTTLRIMGEHRNDQVPVLRQRLVCGGAGTAINCRSLQSLILCYVEVEESEFNNLLSHCPLIQTLGLKGCTGLHKIHVPEKFPGLEKFHITSLTNEMDEVNINAPGLKTFTYKVLSTVRRHDCAFRIKLGSRSLKHLNLSNASVTDDHLRGLLSGCPIENVALTKCHKLRTIDFSSVSLKGYSQIFCDNLMAVNFNTAPSLCAIKCHHSSSTIPYFSFSECTSPMEGRLYIRVSDHVANPLLLKLRDFVSRVKHSWVKVVISDRRASECIDLEELSAVPIPRGHEVKELILRKLPLVSSRYEDLVEGLLWACQPKYFTSDI